MEHMTLSDSSISYYITVYDRSTHQYIGNLAIYILLVIGRISNITGIFQMLWFYTFIVSFEGFTFPHQFPRIHWIQRHFVTTIIGSIWSTHVYWQAQCANGNYIVQYLHPSRLHTSCPETRLPDQYTPFYFTNLSTDNLTIHYRKYLDRWGYPREESYPCALHFHRQRYDSTDVNFYTNAVALGQRV